VSDELGHASKRDPPSIRVDKLHVPPLFGVAADDAHHYHGRGDASPGRGWVMVRAAELSAPAIITAMQKGDFYASSGVILRDVRYSPEAKAFEIEIEPDGNTEFATQFVGTRVGYESSNEPVTDAGGKTLDVTRRYSSNVGKVLLTVRGTRAAYELTGNELYVRATIAASRPPDDPAYEGQLGQTWTQPVGCEQHVRPAGD
jgi:hypothetical protein